MDENTKPSMVIVGFLVLGIIWGILIGWPLWMDFLDLPGPAHGTWMMDQLSALVEWADGLEGQFRIFMKMVCSILFVPFLLFFIFGIFGFTLLVIFSIYSFFALPRIILQRRGK